MKEISGYAELESLVGMDSIPKRLVDSVMPQDKDYFYLEQ